MSHPTHVQERNQDATIYVGDIDQQVDEALLWELMLQAGPVVNVHIPKDKLTGTHSGYGFVEFHSEEDSDYALRVMNMIKLYGKPIRLNKASQDKKTLDVGANLFIGNLDPDVDEKLLYDTFSAFGVIIATPKIMRDPETGQSKGFGFVAFESFDSSDAAINSMNGQFLSGRPISVTYALKKDSKNERHGTPAERLLAANNPNIGLRGRPNSTFAAVPVAPPVAPAMMPPMFAPPPPPGMMPFGQFAPPPPPGYGGMPMGMPPMPPMGMMPPMPPMQQ
jgi:splicing factor 3B subunit 4